MAKYGAKIAYDMLVFVNKKNGKIRFYRSIVDDIVLFINTVMSSVFPAITRKVSEAKRKEFRVFV